MEDITTTNDADYDRRLHSLRRMGFECWTRLDNPTSFPDIRDYRSDDRQFRHLDERRTLQRKRGGRRHRTERLDGAVQRFQGARDAALDEDDGAFVDSPVKRGGF